MICKRVHYRGRVQGVGFRMTARRLAVGFTVTGYVKNLPDNRVELVVAGEPAEIERFLSALADCMADCIEGQDIRDEPLQSFQTFEIRM